MLRYFGAMPLWLGKGSEQSSVSSAELRLSAALPQHVVRLVFFVASIYLPLIKTISNLCCPNNPFEIYSIACL